MKKILTLISIGAICSTSVLNPINSVANTILRDSNENNEIKNILELPHPDNTLNSPENINNSRLSSIDNIASGKLGACEWYIDNEGTLHIGEGSFTHTSVYSPWYNRQAKIDYSDVIKKVIFEGPVYASGDPALFRGLSNLGAIENLTFLNTSQSTSLQGIFQDNLIPSLDLSNFDTSNATSLSVTFSKMVNITHLDISGFNTSNVTNMFSTFSGMINLKELDFTNWDTTNVTSMRDMFNNNVSLHKLILGPKSIFTSIVQLPPIDTSSGQYNGRWIGINSKNYYNSSSEFMDDYNGAIPDSYIWDQTAVNPLDGIHYIGQSWNSKDYFLNAISENGTELDFDNFFIAGGKIDISRVDTNTSGEYPIVFTLNGISSEANVTVKYNKSALNLSDINIYVNEFWKPEDNFESAYDKDGNSVDFSQISVDSAKVDTSKAGIYDVTYSYDDIKSIAKVNVMENKKALNLSDIDIYVGESWKPKDNFESAYDKDGNSVDFSQISVDSAKVDTSKAGIYDVAYSYDDIKSIAKVNVIEKSISDPEKSSDDESPQNEGLKQNDKKSEQEKQHKQILPETSATTNLIISIAGLIMLLLSIILIFNTRTQKK